MNQEIRDEMNGDMLDGCMPVGEIESCLNHWGNKYHIVRKSKSNMSSEPIKSDTEIIFWKDGSYEAKGGFFVRNTLKEFLTRIIESGRDPVGIKIDLKSFDLEVLVKV